MRINEDRSIDAKGEDGDKYGTSGGYFNEIIESYLLFRYSRD